MFFAFHVVNQILALCNCREDVRKKVHAVIDKFAERGLRSLGVARQVGYLKLFIQCPMSELILVFNLYLSHKICLQEIPEKTKESPGAPWQLVGLLPLFDPPRHDSAETIRRALNLGVNVKMITGKTCLLLFPMFEIVH